MAIVSETQLAAWRSQVHRLPYSDGDWAKIVALLPKRLKAKDEKRFRFEIESSAYLIKSVPAGPQTNAKWIVAWQDVAKASKALRDALSVVTEEEIQEEFDAWCSARSNEAHRNIRSIKASTRPRRDSPAIKQLVGQLLDLWSHCGGKLTITIAIGRADKDNDEGHAKGKLIEFLKTATNPILPPEPVSDDELAKKLANKLADRFAHLIKKKRAEEEILANRAKIRADDF
jgi:hypothetical protein